MTISKPSFGFLAAMFLGAVALAQIISDNAPTELLIETSPRAEIFIDGVLVGKATTTGSFAIHNAKPGSHVLKVEGYGKRILTRKIAVAAGKINRINAVLEDFTGDLEVLTAPNAEIMLNGKPAGSADGAGRLAVRGLKAMDYKLRAGGAGYNSEERPITVATGVLTTFTVALKRIEAVEEGVSAPPPDYVLERRITHSQARAVFFSKNGLQLLSIGMGDETGDNTRDRLIQWDPSTGRLLKSFGAGQGANTIMAVSPDLRWVAVKATSDNGFVVRVMDIASGRVVREWPGYFPAFSADSKTVIIHPQNDPGSDYWDIESGKKVQPWPGPSVGRISFSP